MIRYKISNGMKILFVGINPHYGSFQRGIPFSNNKMFWYLLSKAKVIDEPLEDLKDDAKLKTIYHRKFNQVYHLGFVNIINRPTRDVSQLKKGEERAGKKRIHDVVKDYRPKVVCFIGKITYEKFSGSLDIKFGWQKPIDKSKVYVMHFPLRGKASIRVEELRTLQRVR